MFWHHQSYPLDLFPFPVYPAAMPSIGAVSECQFPPCQLSSVTAKSVSPQSSALVPEKKRHTQARTTHPTSQRHSDGLLGSLRRKLKDAAGHSHPMSSYCPSSDYQGMSSCDPPGMGHMMMSLGDSRRQAMGQQQQCPMMMMGQIPSAASSQSQQPSGMIPHANPYQQHSLWAYANLCFQLQRGILGPMAVPTHPAAGPYSFYGDMVPPMHELHVPYDGLGDGVPGFLNYLTPVPFHATPFARPCFPI